jgi:hypothetical protein
MSFGVPGGLFQFATRQRCQVEMSALLLISGIKTSLTCFILSPERRIVCVSSFVWSKQYLSKDLFLYLFEARCYLLPALIVRIVIGASGWNDLLLSVSLPTC